MVRRGNAAAGVTPLLDAETRAYIAALRLVNLHLDRPIPCLSNSA